MKQFRWLTALVVGAFLLTTALAASVDPVVVAGNPSCTDLGYAYEVKSDTGNSATLHTAYGTFTVDSDGTYFDWTSEVGVLAVIAKGGPNANVYYYDPAAFQDTGLSAPDRRPGQPYGLSHVSFCFDEPITERGTISLEKDADASYEQDITWELDKTVNGEKLVELDGAPGDSFDLEWVIEATKVVGDPYNHEASGEIRVTNTSTTNTTVTVDLTDVLSKAGVDVEAATVNCGGGETSVTVAPFETETCTWTAPADVAAELPDLNTVSGVAIATDPAGREAWFSLIEPAEAMVSFEIIRNGDEEVTLADPEFDLDDLIGDSAMRTYEETWVCPSDLALYDDDGVFTLSLTNTATLDGDNTELSSSATVTLECSYEPDGEITLDKDAVASYEQDITWELDKTVNGVKLLELEGAPGDEFDLEWVIEATKVLGDPFNFALSGEIFVTSTSSNTTVTVDLVDVLSKEGVDVEDAAVDCGDGTATAVVAPGETVTCEWSVDDEVAAEMPDLNTVSGVAVATSPAANFVGFFNPIEDATFEIEFEIIRNGDEEVTLADPEFDLDDLIGDSAMRTYEETWVCPSDLALYDDDGVFTLSLTNTATLDGDNTELSSSATVTLDCYLRFNGETAWAANGGDSGELRYSSSNWATYVEYQNRDTYPFETTLFAGQTYEAGTVEFSEAVGGWVTITVTLSGGWIIDPSDMTLAVQDYEDAPSGNPSPGLFEHKITCVDSTTCTIVVPENNFYGVHVNVGYYW